MVPWLSTTRLAESKLVDAENHSDLPKEGIVYTMTRGVHEMTGDVYVINPLLLLVNFRTNLANNGLAMNLNSRVRENALMQEKQADESIIPGFYSLLVGQFVVLCGRTKLAR